MSGKAVLNTVSTAFGESPLKGAFVTLCLVSLPNSVLRAIARKRIALIELGIAFIQVEESGLWHRFILIWRVMVFCIKDGYF